jgi:hypothetical protein
VVDVPAAARCFAWYGEADSGNGRDRSLHALDGCRQLKTTWIAL